MMENTIKSKQLYKGNSNLFLYKKIPPFKMNIKKNLSLSKRWPYKKFQALFLQSHMEEEVSLNLELNPRKTRKKIGTQFLPKGR